MKAGEKMNDSSRDERIPKLIKIRFAGFKYRVLTGDYEAEILENLPAPPPIYDDVDCVKEGKYIRCKRAGEDEFFSWFVPAKENDMPLLVVVPGYEAKLRTYPDVSEKFNLLFISPLGYSTPHGIDVRKACGRSAWPVLHNTLCGFRGGYADWIMDALTVIKFIGDEKLADTDKLAFAGTSQGGAMALILASYFGERCVAACADLPFLIGYSTHRLNDVIYEFPPPPDIRFRPSDARKRMSLVDPEQHASRLNMPLLITSSDIDEDCPQKDIIAFCGKIESEAKIHIGYQGRPHGYSGQFFYDMMNFLDSVKESGCF